jgi:glyoxylase-like metal-dependent hydrolase (beta-lactamase superfamily II)
MKKWTTKSGYLILRIFSGRSNVFLITNGTVNLLVDTSVKQLWSLLVKRLNKLGIKQLDYLILTHTHFDHAANTFRIKENYGARIIVHKEEARYLADGKNILIKGTNRFTHTLDGILKNVNQSIKYPPCSYDFLVDSKMDMKKDGIDLYILHTPGHTPGSISVITDNEIALVGDAMFGIYKGSIFPPFGLDTRQMVLSWGRLLETGCLWFMPSHGSANPRALVEKEYNRLSGKPK